MVQACCALATPTLKGENIEPVISNAAMGMALSVFVLLFVIIILND